MSEPSENPEEPARRKPFQYSLRSLFVITTALAIYLSVGKVIPGPTFALSIGLVVVLPFVFLVRWVMRNREKRTALGLLGSALLIVVPGFLIPVLDPEWDLSYKSPVAGLLCSVMAIGVLSLPIWFFIMVPVWAERQYKLEKEEAARKALEQPSESQQDQR